MLPTKKNMRKIFIAWLALTSLAAVAQQKKGPAKSAAPKNSNKTVVAKSDGLSFEAFKKADTYKLYVLAGKDSLQLSGPSKAAPENAIIKSFSAGGTKLYLVNWTAHYKVGDVKSKLEDITETHSEIWNADTKTRVFENTQSADNISEIVWLDPNKTASKTEEKIRRAGMEFTLGADGSVTLKNKAGESKLKFDPVKQQYVSTK